MNFARTKVPRSHYKREAAELKVVKSRGKRECNLHELAARVMEKLGGGRERSECGSHLARIGLGQDSGDGRQDLRTS